MLSKVIIALLLAAPATARRPKSHELEGYSFEKFAKDYNLEYSGAELASRKALYDLEFARVQAHNAKNLTWKEGINKYSAFTVQEKKSSFGRHKGVAARQAKMLKSQSLDFQVKSAEELPASVDWREKGAPPQIPGSNIYTTPSHAIQISAYIHSILQHLCIYVFIT
jgi:hypothetical protein